MVRYFPLESCASWSDADGADLRLFNWQTATAEFSMLDDERVVTVSFDADVIVRMLDEFPLCTEDKAEDRLGMVPHHFAYRVEGDPFFEAQSETWRYVQGSAQHYRFLTGAGCLDVISTAIPRFALAAK